MFAEAKETAICEVENFLTLKLQSINAQIDSLRETKKILKEGYDEEINTKIVQLMYERRYYRAFKEVMFCAH